VLSLTRIVCERNFSRVWVTDTHLAQWSLQVYVWSFLNLLEGAPIEVALIFRAAYHLVIFFDWEYL
jgi:hypothetical protein